MIARIVAGGFVADPALAKRIGWLWRNNHTATKSHG
jgi:hypothetical protein